MKIVIAPDSFKESLEAIDVARAIEAGLKKIYPNAICDLIPMADGGEGTVDAMVHATNGEFITKTVIGPLGSQVSARFGILGDKTTAVIEMAAASGLPLVPPDQRNPLKTTTYGTGQLIAHALDAGVKKIILGIGGSATVDGGIGAISALGVKFLDKNNNEIKPAGGDLINLTKIDVSGIDPRLKQTEILIACDVSNPLIGDNGAANIFAPQKGATPEKTQILEENLTHYAKLIREQLKIDVADTPGAGAAGGLGAGMLAFAHATLKSGSALVASAVNLSDRLTGADLCITGEGKIDNQSAQGKVAHHVAQVAHEKNIPAIAIVGGIGQEAEKNTPPLTAYFAITNAPMDLSSAIKNAPALLTKQAEQIARLLSIQI